MKHKIRYIFIFLMILLALFSIQKTVTALSVNTSTFQANWNTVVNRRELLCSNEYDSFAGYTYKFQKNGGLHTNTSGQKAWILSSSSDPQNAWWHLIHNDRAHPETQLNRNAELYEDYIAAYSKPTITNLKRESDGDITFKLTGTKKTNNDVTFGAVEKASIVGTTTEGETKEIDITNSVDYGDNTISASTISNLYKMSIRIRTDHTTAEGRWQNYKAYQRYYSGGWHNIKTGSQPLAIYDGSRNHGNDLAVSDEIILTTNVSMQKYITKVNGKSISSRNAWLAGSNVENVPSGTSWNKDVTSGINRIATYKDANPVVIEPGDTVTYAIIVYNNTSYSQKVTVTDSILNSGNMEWKTSGWSLTKTIDGRKQYSRTISIAANRSYTLEVQIKFNGQATSNDVSYYKNKAWISGTQGKNVTTYRTADGDFVKMKKYKVSLEKYVSGVQSTGKSGTNLINNTNSTLYNSNLTNRSGHPIYQDKNKNNNKVQVEIGDTITYTMIIRNTGTDTTNWGTIRVTNITDAMSGYFTNIRCSNGVTYSNGAFSLNATIPVGGRYTFTVTATLNNIAQASSAKSITIQNTATVTQIYNSNGVSVTDSDGTNNNQDSDWIITKTYAVSLKKYISNVSGEETGSIDTSAWETLREYIGTDWNKYVNLKGKINSVNRENILSAMNNASISSTVLEDYMKHDLNGDGKVTQEDYNIYLKESSLQGTDANTLKSLIQDFINSDFNQDNVVDDTDLELFQKIAGDVNGNGIIEELEDIYEWDLLRVQAAGRFNEDYLKKIKIAILQRELNLNNQEDIIEAVENYQKSDVNDDGVVDENDNIQYHENKNNLTKEEINNFIKENDINADSVVNAFDITVEEDLTKQKEGLSQYDKVKNYLQDIQNVEYNEYGEITAEYQEFDINGDGMIDITDYMSAIGNNSLLEKFSQLKSIQLALVVYDYNADRVLNGADYDLAKEQNGETEKSVVYLAKLNEAGDINIELSGLNDEDYINLRKILVAQEELGKLAYDLNNDKVLDENDLTIATETSDAQTESYLKGILNTPQNSTGIERIKIDTEDYMDFNQDGEMNYSDNELLQNYLSCPDEIWEKIKDGTKTAITAEEIAYYDVTNHNEVIYDEGYNEEYEDEGNLESSELVSRTLANEVSEDDVTACEILNLDSYDELIEIFKNIAKADINADGIVNTEDMEIYQQYLESIQNKEESDEQLTFYAIKQFDEEGKLEQFANDLESHIEMGEGENTTSDFGLDINRDGYYSDEKELVEQYRRIQENEAYIQQVNDQFNLLDCNFDDVIDENDYNIYKVLSKNKVYNEDMLNKIELYDITDDGQVNDADIEAIETLYSELSDVETSTSEYYNYVRQNLERESFEIERADITRDYLTNQNIVINSADKEQLESYINQYKDNNQLSAFYDITNTSETKIKALMNNTFNLDINGDGQIDEDDIEVLEGEQSTSKNITGLTDEKFEEYLNQQVNYLDINGDGKIDQSDINMINNFINCDLNGDGQIDSTDLALYDQTKAAMENQDMEDAIHTYCNIGNNQVDTWAGNRSGFAPIYTDQNYKANRPVTVQQGDYVTYTIEVKNDGKTDVYITNILDNLPEAYVTYNGQVVDKINRTDLSGVMISPGKTATITVRVQVTASNMCIDLIENVAEITEMKNRNGIKVEDTTPNNNRDADYIQLRDIDIQGKVWNDINVVKDQNEEGYNGLYQSEDEEKEKLLPDITVYLYRYNKNNGTAERIATTTTNSDGEYTFTSRGRNPTVTDTKIKATYINYDTYFKWNEYCSYYVVFEYDGITYTSTPNGTTCVAITDSTAYENGEYRINSNAREDIGPVKESRNTFNAKFAKIASGEAQYDGNADTKSMDITYSTKNESGFIPQSNHIYSSNTMAMQSSTDLIGIQNDPELEEQLKYVNLGLRGRDIFDLELTSDVARTQVTVNDDKVGVYQFSNKVNIRGTDIGLGEDMANIANESSNHYIEDRNNDEGQQIRNTDLDTSHTGANKTGYDSSQGLKDIKVTYKITVTNASQTNGLATVVTDYYDKCYTNPENAYIEIETQEGIKSSSAVEIKNNDTSNSQYNKVNLHVKDAIEELLGKDGMLTQSQSYSLYFTLTMTQDGINNLKKLFTDSDNNTLSYPTYNMAEISKYKTSCGSGQTEYTRGLIDKDSAPGSVEKEQVRTRQTEGQNTATTRGNPTTVQYYFNAQNLSDLKYEDDTYATPTLYFVSVDAKRTITGTVFEDYTEIINNNDDNELIRTKTGDGKQTGDEPGIEGATVQLVELETDRNAEEIAEEEGTVRYETTTDENGDYAFSGFLPGNYVIRYYYGDTEGTFTYDNQPNTKSYNGEDFQSTNNAYDVEGADVNKLNATQDLWYAFNENEGVSTGTDNSARRKKVSTDVTSFTDEQMTVLNNVRDGKSMEDANVTYYEEEQEKVVTAESIMQSTEMFATTPCMELTMEKTVAVTEDNAAQNTSFQDYTVSNMNFGIAEVPVTTIDLQKHVYSLTIEDSAGDNTIAAAEIDRNNTSVVVNPSKIARNRINTVISVLSESLNMSEEEVRSLIDYENNLSQDTNIPIKQNATATQIESLQEKMTQYSLAREINIVYAWKVTAGNVLTAPGTSVIDVSIENEKLQGAKLEVTYEITANIYAEKNFNNEKPIKPSIEGIVDYIDNDLSYNENLIGTQPETNNNYWTVSTQDYVAGLYQESYGTNENRLGTLDPEGTKYTTILTANEKEGGLLLEECGTGTAYITLERVLSAEDTSIGDIITSSINTYEYDNNIEITGIHYPENTGDFIFRDRVRTADRYIILAGIQHDTATSETISIHPPTGENNSMVYYIIAVISLVILAIGIVLIKKYAIKGKTENK